MTQGSVSYESENDVAVITIRRPDKRNSITSVVAEQLEQAWLQFEVSSDRVAVLTGEGSQAFTGGVDMTDPPTGGYPYVAGLGTEVTKPIICAVSGWCVGVGMAFVQYADLCVASESAVFYYPEAKMGLGRGILAGLVSRMPHKIVAELMMLGQQVPAARMEQHGLVNRLTTDDDLLPTALEMAGVIAAQDPSISQFYKRNLQAVLVQSPGEIAERTRLLGDRLPGNAAANLNRARRSVAAASA